MNETFSSAPLLSAQSMYVIGIGGIGTSALTQLLLADGKTVSGEDLAESAVTHMLREKGVEIAIGKRAQTLESADLIYFSSAVPADHPARVYATEQGIPQLQYFEALGQYMQQFEYAIAISGTHGKTTTTAMVARVLEEAGLDPTVVVGSLVREYGNSNARIGSAEKNYIVVEACEHEAHMLYLKPSTIVVNNIEADHLDFYRDLDHIVQTFQEFVNGLSKHTQTQHEYRPSLIVNADDVQASSLTAPEGVLRRTYGIQHVADVQAFDIGVHEKQQFFTVNNVDFRLRVPGEHNVSNALAAIAAAQQCAIPLETAARGLSGFSGTWRRFEVLGEYAGATIISDYGHHPTEIQKTIRAARQFYPHSRIVLVFQPHQRTRTRELFGEFIEAIKEADIRILQEVYDVAGREEESTKATSSQSIVDRLRNDGYNAMYTQDATTTIAALDEALHEDDIVLVMGAGDIYRVAEELVSR